MVKPSGRCMGKTTVMYALVQGVKDTARRPDLARAFNVDRKQTCCGRGLSPLPKIMRAFGGLRLALSASCSKFPEKFKKISTSCPKDAKIIEEVAPFLKRCQKNAQILPSYLKSAFPCMHSESIYLPL